MLWPIRICLVKLFCSVWFPMLTQFYQARSKLTLLTLISNWGKNSCIFYLLKISFFPAEMCCKFLKLYTPSYVLMYIFVAMPGSRINTQAVAPLRGLFLTCGKSEPLKIISITYRNNWADSLCSIECLYIPYREPRWVWTGIFGYIHIGIA